MPEVLQRCCRKQNASVSGSCPSGVWLQNETAKHEEQGILALTTVVVLNTPKLLAAPLGIHAKHVSSFLFFGRLCVPHRVCTLYTNTIRGEPCTPYTTP